MKRLAIPLACILPLALASCGGNLAPVAASLTPAVLSAETVASLRTWCARGQPLLDLGRLQSLSPAAREIAETVGPYCSVMAAGVLPATTDGNSLRWIIENMSGLAKSLGLSPPSLH